LLPAHRASLAPAACLVLLGISLRSQSCWDGCGWHEVQVQYSYDCTTQLQITSSIQKGPQEALPVWMARAQEVLIDVDLNHTTPLPTLNEAMLMLDAQRPQQRMGATD
jgi:hypothetical protein